jgi:hypothetical protein
MREAPDDHDADWLRRALQWAIQLEMSTIPPYLCAMWSIKNSVGPVYDRIDSIVKQEMFHMGLACNLLNTIDGSPLINTATVVPKYPGPLPGEVHPGLEVGLEGLSKRVVETVFMEVEKPDWPSVIKKEAETFATIGLFYDAIRSAFERLHENEITGQKQVKFGPTLFAITNKSDVLRALKIIQEQGEGTPSSPLNPTGKPAHYYTFGEILHEKEAVLTPDGWRYQGLPVPFPDDVYPMAPVPPGGYVESLEFDKIFTQTLNKLQEAWNQGESDLLNDARDLMLEMAEPARALMEKPLPSQAQGNYGPSFLLIH